jgi:hypothetical protein
VEAVVEYHEVIVNFYRIVESVDHGGALVPEWKAGRSCTCQRVTSLRHHARDLVHSIDESCLFEHVLNVCRIVHCNVLLASYETIGIPFPGRECPKVLDPKGLLEAQEKGLEVRYFARSLSFVIVISPDWEPSIHRLLGPGNA